jgi:hypothetical protein
MGELITAENNQHKNRNYVENWHIRKFALEFAFEVST